ncbi:MAG: lysophospholipid acyltransferase family protein [Actinomycetota bacterium]
MLYRLLWFTIGPPIKLYWRIRPVRRKKVPRGGVIVASNHRAAPDPILICMCFGRSVRWLAKIELVKSKKVAWFFRMAQVIPVDRNAPDDVWLDKAARLLRRPNIFGIFPEGTRSPDGRVYKGYTGVARLAERSGKPVVPTAILGSDKSHQKGRALARSVRTEVRFGDPMWFERRAGEDAPAAYRRFTDEVCEAIAALAGVEYVPDKHSYEARREQRTS